MKWNSKLKWLWFFLAFIPIGCAQVPREAGFDDVQGLVGQRIDYRLHWNQGTEADAEVEKAVEQMLKKELTLDAAIQISLLNNPRLQAVYEELGITQADVVEAGLLENPVIFGQARFPDRSPSLTNLEFGVTQNFLNILMLPARKKLAAIQFEQIKLKAAENVINMAADVQKGFYEALAAKQVNRMRKLIAEAARNSHEMAGRLYGAGNIGALELANEQGQFEQARIALAKSEAELLSAREKLTGLMGLWGKQTTWTVPDLLPELPQEEVRLEHLEAYAIENRFDLAASRKEVEAMAQALGITIDWRYFGSIDVGISSERDTDGQWVTGPSLALEVPIFNQRQADIARLESQLRMSHKRMAARAIEIRSEIRSLRSRLIMARNLIEHYLKVILPLRERIVDLTLKKYNYMLVGTFDLLMAKKQEFDDYQNYIEALRDYWVIRADLKKAAGGRLPGVRESDISHSEISSKFSSKNVRSKMALGSTMAGRVNPVSTPDLNN